MLLEIFLYVTVVSRRHLRYMWLSITIDMNYYMYVTCLCSTLILDRGIVIGHLYQLLLIARVQNKAHRTNMLP